MRTTWSFRLKIKQCVAPNSHWDCKIAATHWFIFSLSLNGAHVLSGSKHWMSWATIILLYTGVFTPVHLNIIFLWVLQSKCKTSNLDVQYWKLNLLKRGSVTRMWPSPTPSVGRACWSVWACWANTPVSTLWLYDYWSNHMPSSLLCPLPSTLNAHQISCPISKQIICVIFHQDEL